MLLVIAQAQDDDRPLTFDELVEAGQILDDLLTEGWIAGVRP